MAQKFLTLDEGQKREVEAVVSGGGSNAGKVPALDADGLLASSMLPIHTDRYKLFSGFVNRTDSTLSINGSGLFSLTSVGANFVVHTWGKKHTLSGVLTAQVVADQTITYIYIDSDGALQKSTDVWMISNGTAAPVAIVFKDGSNYTWHDERHGYTRDLSWHAWAHATIGAMYHGHGFGASFGDASMSIDQGVVADEDIFFDTVVAKDSGNLWYRNGGTGMRLVVGGASAVKGLVGGILAFDDNSGTLAPVSLNRYIANFVYATNDTVNPFYVVVGQAASGSGGMTLTEARNSALPTINLSTAEWKLLYKVIYRRTVALPSGDYIEFADYRSVQTGVPTSGVTPSDHSSLINRDAANAHPISAITDLTDNLNFLRSYSLLNS